MQNTNRQVKFQNVFEMHAILQDQDKTLKRVVELEKLVEESHFSAEAIKNNNDKSTFYIGSTLQIFLYYVRLQRNKGQSKLHESLR